MAQMLLILQSGSHVWQSFDPDGSHIMDHDIRIEYLHPRSVCANLGMRVDRSTAHVGELHF